MRGQKPYKQSFRIRRVLLLGAGSGIGFFMGLAALAAVDGTDDSQTFRALDRFGQAFSIVRSEYVEPVEDKMLVENALSGMISSLDPHSSYFDPKTFADMQVRTEGQYGGVGIIIESVNGAVKVVAPIDDTPASRADVPA